MKTLRELKEKLQAHRALFAQVGAMVDANKLLGEVLGDLEEIDTARTTETVPLQDAAAATGLHPDSIGRMIRTGRAKNYGTKRRPLVRVAELPSKPKATSSPIANSETTGDTTANQAPVFGGTIAFDALASRHGRRRPA